MKILTALIKITKIDINMPTNICASSVKILVHGPFKTVPTGPGKAQDRLSCKLPVVVSAKTGFGNKEIIEISSKAMLIKRIKKY